MTDGAPPGLTGPVGTPGAASSRLGKAWMNVVHVQFVTVPKAVQQSKIARMRMQRLGRVKRGR